MRAQQWKNIAKRRPSVLPALDRAVLLGFLFLVLLIFIAAWFASRDFMAGARLFPNFVAVLGAAVTLLAAIRVWLGIEPGHGVGQVLPTIGESSWPAYRFAGRMILGISVYYVGIYFIGFMPATLLFLIIFLRLHKLSWRFVLTSTAVALGFVYGLSELLNLYLPWGVFF